MEYIVDSKTLNECQEIDAKKVHLLPCNIQYSGPAEVDAYFIVKDCKEEKNDTDQKAYMSAFRGRGLKGVESKKMDYTGYVLKKCPADNSNKEKYGDTLKNILKAEKKFDSFMIWNHDDTPTLNNNTCLNSLAWLEVANEINKQL